MPPPVLVVDDEDTIRDLVAEALEVEGYDVVKAANGQEALAAVDAHNPSVVLLDMRMPVMDGWGFARAMAQRGSRIPIVVMTAAENAARWCQEIGANATLPKPFDLDQLYETVAAQTQPSS